MQFFLLPLSPASQRRFFADCTHFDRANFMCTIAKNNMQNKKKHKRIANQFRLEFCHPCHPCQIHFVRNFRCCEHEKKDQGKCSDRRRDRAVYFYAQFCFRHFSLIPFTTTKIKRSTRIIIAYF